MSNLRLLNETTVSSAVASLDVTDVFTSNFDIYKIVYEDFTVATGTDFFRMRLINSSGSVISTTSYDTAGLNMRANTTFVERRETSSNKGVFPILSIDDGAAEGVSGVVYLFNPFSSSSYSIVIHQNTTWINGNFYNNKTIGVLKDTTSISGFRLGQGDYSQNLDSGTVKTYGLRVDT
jgi:hypothetical protein